MKSKNIKLSLINSVLPLLVAGLLYLAFRSTDLLMFKWLNAIGLHDSIEAYRGTLLSIKDNVPSWMYFSLPNALWVYAFTSSLIIIWSNQVKVLRFWLLFPLLLGVIIELFQLVHFVRGTFDIVDLLLSLVAWSLSILIVNSKIK